MHLACIHFVMGTKAKDSTQCSMKENEGDDDGKCHL